MRRNSVTRIAALTLAGLLGSGCAIYHPPSSDPYFAGYHRKSEPGQLTPPVADRGELVVVETPAGDLPEESIPSIRDRYRDPSQAPGAWSRDGYGLYDSYRPYGYGYDPTTSLSLGFGRYGPYASLRLRPRPWLTLRYGYGRLPWYANGWMFADTWGDPFWREPFYGGLGGYDPFLSYGRYDSYYFGNTYGVPYGYFNPYYYGAVVSGSGQSKPKAARSRNRRGRRGMDNGPIAADPATQATSVVGSSNGRERSVSRSRPARSTPQATKSRGSERQARSASRGDRSRSSPAASRKSTRKGRAKKRPA